MLESTQQYLQRHHIRAKNRCRVRLRAMHRGFAVGGHLIDPSQGDVEVTVYEDEYETAQAMVEPEYTDQAVGDLAKARQADWVGQQRWITEKLGKSSESEWWDAEKGCVRNQEEGMPDRVARLRRQYPGSVEAQFKRANGRSLLPLSKCELLERFGPPDEADPRIAERKREEQRRKDYEELGTVIARAVTESLNAETRKAKR